jgi:hypothetical protein
MQRTEDDHHSAFIFMLRHSPLINPQSIDLLLLLWGSMVLGVINVSTGGRVSGSILLPNALQVELSSISEDDGGIDGLVGLLLGLSLVH